MHQISYSVVVTIKEGHRAKEAPPGGPRNLTVVNFEHKRLTPPDHLTEREVKIFRDIVDSCAPLHFRESELPVLCAYVTAVNLSQWHAKKINDGDPSHHRQWLDCTKLVALRGLVSMSANDPKRTSASFPSPHGRQSVRAVEDGSAGAMKMDRLVQYCIWAESLNLVEDLPHGGAAAGRSRTSSIARYPRRKGAEETRQSGTRIPNTMARMSQAYTTTVG